MMILQPKTSTAICNSPHNASSVAKPLLGPAPRLTPRKGKRTCPCCHLLWLDTWSSAPLAPGHPESPALPALPPRERAQHPLYVCMQPVPPPSGCERSCRSSAQHLLDRSLSAPSPLSLPCSDALGLPPHAAYIKQHRMHGKSMPEKSKHTWILEAWCCQAPQQQCWCMLPRINNDGEIIQTDPHLHPSLAAKTQLYASSALCSVLKSDRSCTLLCKRCAISAGERRSILPVAHALAGCEMTALVDMAGDACFVEHLGGILATFQHNLLLILPLVPEDWQDGYLHQSRVLINSCSLIAFELHENHCGCKTGPWMFEKVASPTFRGLIHLACDCI
jgi:hypothetical protein